MYHAVFVPKRRRNVLFGQVCRHLGETSHALAARPSGFGRLKESEIGAAGMTGRDKVRGFWQLINVDPGFNPNHGRTFPVDLPSVRCPAGTILVYRQLLARLRTLPGVLNASVIEPVPLGGNNIACSCEIESRPTSPGLKSAKKGLDNFWIQYSISNSG